MYVSAGAPEAFSEPPDMGAGNPTQSSRKAVHAHNHKPSLHLYF